MTEDGVLHKVIASIDNTGNFGVEGPDGNLVKYHRISVVVKIDPSYVNDGWLIGRDVLSEDGEWFTVVRHHNKSSLVVRWSETGHHQHACCENKVASGAIKQRGKRRICPSKNYVYLAWHAGTIVYVGKGNSFRYTHVTSGKSSNYGLNKLHFSGADVSVEIHTDGLTPYEATELEDKLIKELMPCCNIIGKPDGKRAATK